MVDEKNNESDSQESAVPAMLEDDAQTTPLNAELGPSAEGEAVDEVVLDGVEVAQRHDVDLARPRGREHEQRLQREADEHEVAEDDLRDEEGAHGADHDAGERHGPAAEEQERDPDAHELVDVLVVKVPVHLRL